MAARQRRPKVSANDVRLAELHRLTERDQLIINGARAVFSILAIAVPLVVLRDIIVPFAGEDTSLSIELGLVGVSWTITTTVSIAWGAQRRTIKRLKERNENLEDRLFGKE